MMKDFEKKLNNVYITSKKESDIVSQLKNLDNKRTNIIISSNCFEQYNDLIDIYMILKKNYVNFSWYNIMVQVDNTNLSSDVLNNILRFSDFLFKKEEAFLFVKEENVLWELSEVENARNVIYNDIEKLKSLNLSTFEQFLYLYNLVGNRIYHNEQNGENSKISRSVIGVMNSDRIVCTGYANLLNIYVSVLNNPSLKCDTCIVDLYKKEEKDILDSHCVNVVFVKDEKYDICGTYMADCCWDSKRSQNDVVSLAYCLIPAKDVVFYDNCVMVPSFQKDCKYYYFLSDIKPQVLLKCVNQSAVDGLNIVPNLNLKEEREKFRNKLIEQYTSSLVQDDEQKIELLKDELSGTYKFKNESYEYSFLRYMYNKIQKNSLPISYEKYSKALLNVVPKLYSNVDYAKQIEQILKKSKDLSFKNYAGGAQNCFSKLSKSEFDLFEARRKEEQERRQKLKQKTIEKLKQKNI